MTLIIIKQKKKQEKFNYANSLIYKNCKKQLNVGVQKKMSILLLTFKVLFVILNEQLVRKKCQI